MRIRGEQVAQSGLIEVVDTVGGVGLSAGAPVAFEFDTVTVQDPGYSFSSPSSDITVLRDGVYRVHVMAAFTRTGGNNGRVTCDGFLEVNGAAVAGCDGVALYSRNLATGQGSFNIPGKLLVLTAGDVVRFTAQVATAGGATAASRANASFFNIQRLR